MKTISPKIIKLFIIMTAMIFIGSCNKRNNAELQEPNDETLTNLDKITVSDDFEWNTSQNIEFTISGSTAQLITINSIDREVRYHRGYYRGNGDYYITINIPTSVKSVMVNHLTVNIGSDNIICNLDQ